MTFVSSRLLLLGNFVIVRSTALVPRTRKRATLFFPKILWPTTRLSSADGTAWSSRLWMSTSTDDNKGMTKEQATPLESRSNPHTSRALFLGQFVPAALTNTVVVVALVAMAMGLLYGYQGKLLYIPEMEEQGIFRHNDSNPKMYASPAEYNIPFETHMIKSSDDGVAIHSWLLLHPKSESVPTIMFFHGNAG